MSDILDFSEDFENTLIEYENQLHGPEEYLLFCGQEANFQTRTMLIPKKLFTEKRFNDWEKIKSFSKPMENVSNGFLATIEIQGPDFDGDEEFVNLSKETKEFGKLCRDFTRMANGLNSEDGEYYYFDEDDSKWYPNATTNLGIGFRHEDVFSDLMDMQVLKKRNIIVTEGILCLETVNGKLRSSSKYKDPDEMLYNIYFKDFCKDFATFKKLQKS